jgi:hypothetical protein
MLYQYAFESSYGYNSHIRLGKIYSFQSKTEMVDLISVNRDLTVLNNSFQKFSRYVKIYLQLKNIHKYFTPKHIHQIEIGERSMTQVINKILNRNKIIE